MKDYTFSNDFSKNLDAMIYTCGYETCAPSHSYGPVVRSGYLIHYILSGKGIYKTDGHICQLSEGDAFLIRPNTLIYYEADRYHPWTYTWIGFQGIKIEEYLKRTSLMEIPYFHYGKDDRVRLCHEKMFEAYNLPENRDLIMNSILYEYLYLLASKFPRKYIPPKEKKITYVEEALRYIESNYSQSVNIQVIADYLNIERTYLYRLFKDITGSSPNISCTTGSVAPAHCSRKPNFQSAISPGPWDTKTHSIFPGCLCKRKGGLLPSTAEKKCEKFVNGVRPRWRKLSEFSPHRGLTPFTLSSQL